MSLTIDKVSSMAFWRVKPSLRAGRAGVEPTVFVIRTTARTTVDLVLRRIGAAVSHRAGEIMDMADIMGAVPIATRQNGAMVGGTPRGLPRLTSMHRHDGPPERGPRLGDTDVKRAFEIPDGTDVSVVGSGQERKMLSVLRSSVQRVSGCRLSRPQ
jgi:hypothetical protein